MSELDSHLQGLRQSVDSPGGTIPSVPAPSRGAIVERSQPKDLADILERVLNTGIVIAGEIRIDLLDIELLTIKLRLVITSLDRAEEVGLDWWRNDPWYSSKAQRRQPQTDSGDPGGERSIPGERRAVGGADDSRQSNGAGDGDEGAGGRSEGESDEQQTSSSSGEGASKSVYAEEVVAMSASSARPTSRRSEQRSGDRTRRKRSADEVTVPAPDDGRGRRTDESSAPTKKPASSEESVSKRATRKRAAKGTGSKKSATKKAAPQKRAAEKAASQKRATKKAASRKSAAKKAGSKKAASQKAAGKKSTATADAVAEKRDPSMEQKRTAAKRDTEKVAASTTA